MQSTELDTHIDYLTNYFNNYYISNNEIYKHMFNIA